VRPLRVVGRQPGGGHVTHLGQRGEEPGIEHLGAVGPVEALDEGVLARLPRLDVMQADPVGRASVEGPDVCSPKPHTLT
jgi:hypothetical protein